MKYQVFEELSRFVEQDFQPLQGQGDTLKQRGRGLKKKKKKDLACLSEVPQCSSLMSSRGPVPGL